MPSAALLDPGHKLASWSPLREGRRGLPAGPAPLVPLQILNCGHEVVGGERLLIQVERLSSC